MINGHNGANVSDSGSEFSGDSSNGSAGAVRRRLDRKMSSPMAPPFMVSAPGKVIVFGEHSVVHGKVRYSPPYNVNCMHAHVAIGS